MRFGIIPSDDGGKAVRLVRIREDVRKQHPVCLSISLTYGSAGLPEGKDSDRIDRIEDAVMDQLGSKGVLFAGHVLSAGKGRLIFYARGPVATKVTVKHGFLKKEEVRMEARSDADWSVYRTELEPHVDQTTPWMTLMLLDQLQRAGDRWEVPREVDFMAEFSTAFERDAFVGAAVALGYSAGQNEDEPGSFLAALTRVTAVEPKTLVPLLDALEELAHTHNGELDGWASGLGTG